MSRLFPDTKILKIDSVDFFRLDQKNVSDFFGIEIFSTKSDFGHPLAIHPANHIRLTEGDPSKIC